VCVLLNITTGMTTRLRTTYVLLPFVLMSHEQVAEGERWAMKNGIVAGVDVVYVYRYNRNLGYMLCAGLSANKLTRSHRRQETNKSRKKHTITESPKIHTP
jgi:hypothetical protein